MGYVCPTIIIGLIIGEGHNKGGDVMRQKFWIGLFSLVTIILLVGCATQRPPVPFKAQELSSDQYKQKVDNFVVILDKSKSMGEFYEGRSKLSYAKDIVSRLNQTIPEMQLTGALMDYPGGVFSSVKDGRVYEMAPYSEADFEDALNKLKPASGNSPMAAAIDAAGADLKSSQGDTALIILSDGKVNAKKATAAAQNLKSQFGDRLCIHTILVGDSSKGKEVMGEVARVSECGVGVNADDIASAGAMAGFVKTAFLEEVIDSDGDGVPDNLDKCPNTPRGVAVDANGCPLDADGDGVPDYLDKCPNTPQGVKVDAEGCPLDSDGDGVPDHLDECPDTPKGATVNRVGCWALQGVVLFDFNKSYIKPEAHGLLDEVVVIMKKNPELKGVIEGHTDSIGSEGYNQGLSERRARSVEKYIEEHGIDPDRFTTRGYGESKPIASNDTEEGRRENRRVELKRAP
jgi:OOP family OmpA-OmpF porin